ncbi:MAG: hypothetical protein FWD57_04485, partial [Polyangiaceae bacterium]|nr:hypothetical protein [Polyangiaceae bacterium]
MKSRASMKVHIQGAGKIGSAFARGLKAAGWVVSLRAARNGIPARVNADAILLALRDTQLAAEAEHWVDIVGA